MIFIVLWSTILAFLAIYFLRSPKVRSWLSILVRSKLLRRIVIATSVVLASIAVVYSLHPQKAINTTDFHEEFERYSRQAIFKLDSMGRMSVDSVCNLEHPKPELTYVAPLILNTYIEIVEKPTKPALVRLDDTLQIELRGYKQFKNRGIRLTRQLQRKLGNRYVISISSEGSVHTLQIIYNGNSWDKEQLMALPVTEAALKNKLDPALLMSLIRHVSDFDFNFRGPRDTHGLLAMGGHSNDENCEMDGLDQVFAGAEILQKKLQVQDIKNAIATFYPERDMDYRDANWTKSPLIKSWVEQVLSDVEFYRSNGIGAISSGQ